LFARDVTLEYSGRKGMKVPWIKVVVETNESRISDLSVNAFMEKFYKSYREQHQPNEAKIYQLPTHSARRVLYLSPKAAELCKEFLSEYHDVSEMYLPPDTNGFDQLVK
jgi:hypothetical protein